MRALTGARRHADALSAARALLKRTPSQRDALYGAAVNLRQLDQISQAVETLAVLEGAHPGYGRGFEEQG